MVYEHCMVDIETLDTVNTAVILQIAAVPFDIYSMPGAHGEAFVYHPNASSQVEDGRTISPDTVYFWDIQLAKNPKLESTVFNKDNAFPSPGSKEAAESFVRDMVGFKVFWARGVRFDFSILENWISSYGLKAPWEYYNLADVRTLDHFSRATQRGNHDAVTDCVAQINHVQSVMSEVRCGRRVAFR